MRNLPRLWTPLAITVAAIACTCQAQAQEQAQEQTQAPSTPAAAAWYRSGAAAVAERLQQAPNTGKARNVILFVGDGMGVSTVTAARILEGQRRGGAGEDHVLAFEQLPYLALAKTYSATQQTPDSAPTATALFTGIKTRDRSLSVDETVTRDVADAAVIARHSVPTLLEQAAARGLATGIVTTTRVTHATPAALYAHVPNREWEWDARLPAGATVPDIAAQLVAAQQKYGINVVLGGGRGPFMSRSARDPEYADRRGEREDGRALIADWLAAQPHSQYVWNAKQFAAVEPRTTRHLLGLFEPSHMQYEHDRRGEPSLAEMTAKAIEILGSDPQGFLLMVEAGRIDHAHHAGNAYRALGDTIALSDAVRTALSMTSARDTLVVVTADHSLPFTFSGYPKRGNPILGLVVEPGATGPKLALDGKPYTSLGYANGSGHAEKPADHDIESRRTPNAGRHLHPDDDVGSPGYYQEALVPLGSTTHGGEDVAIYAGGPQAHLFRGTMEQHVVYHVIRRAFGW
jgi:alkaline phosphatase